MFPGDEFFLRAFYQLSTCRRFQGAPVPWDMVAAYAEAWQLSPDMGVTLSIVVRRMDDAYLEWHRKEAERRAEQDKGPIGRAWSRVKGPKRG